MQSGIRLGMLIWFRGFSFQIAQSKIEVSSKDSYPPAFKIFQPVSQFLRQSNVHRANHDQYAAFLLIQIVELATDLFPRLDPMDFKDGHFQSPSLLLAPEGRI
jgi:hypothetical protein